MTAAILGLVAVLAGQVAELPTLILPPGADAWVVRVVTTGGFTGRGAGKFTASSAGEMICVAASCPRQLVPGARRSLSQLVAAIGAAEPTPPRTSPLSPGTCSDCITIALTVQRRDADAERTFTYTWDLSTASAVPEAVLRLHAAVVALAEARTQ